MAMAQAGAAQSPAQAEGESRAQRAAFNRAIAAHDISGIGAVLADNVQLVTGTDSKVVAGKQAQLAIWSGDPGDASRLIYVRTPDRITVSPLLPIAMETGHWRGAPAASAKDWVGGDYAAKWRRIEGVWLVESETYVTTGCGGSGCPKVR